ncbi:MAG: bifunctional phosphatase PAP2/diacylglycerol kinase family protein [Actinomycetota bacterium]|nr:phosphatase PAP2 family protein [Actinomycetota bacterium]
MKSWLHGTQRLMRRVHRIDLRLFRKVAKVEHQGVNDGLVHLSRAANHSRLWIAIAFILASLGRRAGRRAGLRGMLSIAIGSPLVNFSIKRIARRRRPHMGVVPKGRHLMRIPTSGSFPSGHAASAFAFAFGAGIEWPATAPFLLGLASTVAYSRVYTGVHYPGDVIAGAVLGVSSALSTKRFWPTIGDEPAPGSPVLRRVAAEPSKDGSGLTVVINPSGHGVTTDVTKQISDQLPAARVVHSQPDSLTETIRAEAQRTDVIGVAGGDGSVNAAAAIAREMSLPLAVFPAGTLNHLAKDLGITSLDDAIESIKEGSAASVDTASIDDQLFLNTAGFGIYPVIVDIRQRYEDKIGKWPALALALALALRRYEPVDVEVDGRPMSIWMAFIGNCRYGAPGFTPGERTSLDDGVLDVRIVEATGKHPGLRLFASVMTGRLHRSGQYHAIETKGLHVRCMAGPLRLAHDGETFDGSQEFSICKNEQRINIFAPTQ